MVTLINTHCIKSFEQKNLYSKLRKMLSAYTYIAKVVHKIFTGCGRTLIAEKKLIEKTINCVMQFIVVMIVYKTANESK